MAQVFRGKIAIPGDQMEDYFEALGQFEKGIVKLTGGRQNPFHSAAIWVGAEAPKSHLGCESGLEMT